VGGTPNQVMAVALRRLPPRFVDAFVRLAQRFTIGDLSAYGLPKPERGVYTRVIEDDVIPIIDVGLIDCVKRGQVEVVGALLGFDGPEVVLSGHERIQPEDVIVATGYRRGLEPLVGPLGVLGPDGKPLVNGAHTHPAAPGLYFTGYTNPISGMFRELKIDARRIAKAVAAELR
jgi:putative flavoprotein involved in K+ transport